MLRWLEEAGFGYLVRAHPGPRLVDGAFQDIALYCYRPTTALDHTIKPG
jgi:hypothetical protein